MGTSQLGLPPRWRSRSALALGLAAWAVAIGALGRATSILADRESHDTVPLTLAMEKPGQLHRGDIVYLETEGGLVRTGEVKAVSAADAMATLTVEPSAFELLNTSTQATCWRAPLAAEDALAALLPPIIQQQAGEQFLQGWQEHAEALAQTWAPLAADLLSTFVDTIGEDVSAAFRRHRDELSAVANRHGAAFAQAWPILQQHLRPILQEHLTPVLAHLINEAINDAPKMKIAWHMARGRYADAYRLMLNWLADYLADLSDKEKAELGEALQITWEKAKDDPVIAATLTELGRDVLEDPQLQHVLIDIYREAITENPKAAMFLRQRVLESPQVRQHVFQFVDMLAPIVRRVTIACLFDERGVTRPEIAYLVRSIALGRPVTWITLRTVNQDAKPLSPGATLVPVWKGGFSR